MSKACSVPKFIPLIQPRLQKPFPEEGLLLRWRLWATGVNRDGMLI